MGCGRERLFHSCSDHPQRAVVDVHRAAHGINKEVSWGKLEESVRLASRQVDTLIDINVLPFVIAADIIRFT